MRVSRVQAQKNHERIIDVASQLFRERGFDGIGLNDVMEAAGLTRGGFYGHFPSKEELAVEACGRALKTTLERWSALVDRPVLRGRPIEVEEIIGDLMRRGAKVRIATPLLSAAYVHLLLYQHKVAAPR
jgi:AcrR family transcriptional regulator